MIGRREFTLALGAASLAACGRSSAQTPKKEVKIMPETLSDAQWANISNSEWRERLTQMEFYVLREEGTERPGSSPLDNEKRKGSFVCAGCGLELFTSDMKYDSGTGWPSFYTVVQGAVGTKEDNKLFAKRTEYHCARCGGHQGHVFGDGPHPTGLRYCNNGVALDFVPAES